MPTCEHRGMEVRRCVGVQVCMPTCGHGGIEAAWRRVEVARMEEAGSLEDVGSSGNVSLSEKVVLVLLAVEAGAVKASSRSFHQGRCCRGGFLKHARSGFASCLCR